MNAKKSTMSMAIQSVPIMYCFSSLLIFKFLLRHQLDAKPHKRYVEHYHESEGCQEKNACDTIYHFRVLSALAMTPAMASAKHSNPSENIP